MIPNFFQQQHKKLQHQEKQTMKNKAWGVMEQYPGLSLGPSQFAGENANSSSSGSEMSLCRKRKQCWDNEPMIESSIDLQVKDPLPLDWEQCLDLESGRMYYVNKKTLKKSWNCPIDQKLDLELNTSSLYSDDERSKVGVSKRPNNSGNNNMVALACLRCHLLVMLSKSSPSCPNCKYVHSLSTQQSPPPKVSTVKSLETLSLLH